MIVDGSLDPESVVYSQSVDVVPGRAYTLSLWLSGSFVAMPAILRLDLAGGSPGLNELGATNTTGVWEKNSIDFVATSESLTFSLVDLNSDYVGNDFGLDTIELTEIQDDDAVVPEPVTMWLVAGGVAGVLLARRRQNR
jgi:hypothetical protein